MAEEPGRNALPPTNEDTSGPYFPIYFQDESLEGLTRVGSGIVAGARGTHIILRGKITDRHGNLAHGAILEFLQVNAKGVYRTPSGHPDIDPRFNGYGRLRSDTGTYSFRTVMPGPTHGRAPNITITLFSDGISRIVTQMFFPDQTRNNSDPLLAGLEPEDRSRQMARHDGRIADGAEVYLFDFVMLWISPG